MKLSDNAIQEFKEIYLKKFGVELSCDFANKLGIELLNFFNLIYKPISVERKIPVVNLDNKVKSDEQGQSEVDTFFGGDWENHKRHLITI